MGAASAKVADLSRIVLVKTSTGMYTSQRGPRWRRRQGAEVNRRSASSVEHLTPNADPGWSLTALAAVEGARRGPAAGELHGAALRRDPGAARGLGSLPDGPDGAGAVLVYVIPRLAVRSRCSTRSSSTCLGSAEGHPPGARRALAHRHTPQREQLHGHHHEMVGMVACRTACCSSTSPRPAGARRARSARGHRAGRQDPGSAILMTTITTIRLLPWPWGWAEGGSSTDHALTGRHRRPHRVDLSPSNYFVAADDRIAGSAAGEWCRGSQAGPPDGGGD